jgi:hypothetical protein
MDPGAKLILMVADDPTAVRLVAVWPNVPRDTDGSVEVAPTDRLKARWAEYAGLTRHDVNVRWVMLVGNGICKMDGTVHPVVEAYVQRVALARLPASVLKALASAAEKSKTEKGGEKK